MRQLFRKNQKAVFVGMLLFLMSCFCLGGCKEETEKKDGKIEFTVCSEEMIPAELKKLIEEKKQHAFAISFISGEEMYVVVGYGKHDKRNLNVVVDDFYMTGKVAYLDTSLLTTETPDDTGAAGEHPAAGEHSAAGEQSAVGEHSMYPYIVLKCARFDAPIYYNVP